VSMKTVARIILIFFGLLFIGGALLLLSIYFNLRPGLAIVLPVWATDNVLLAIGSVLLLNAHIYLTFGLRSSKKIGNAVLNGIEYGEVLISITALENMVLRVVQQTQGIKDVSRQVSFTPDGLVVRVRIRVMPDIALPGLINELQSKTKEYLEEITGIVVHEVKVMVENIIVDQAVSKK
ncbi:MAG: alkaline shock response membrane anchor protein AmaP, partial [Dethiobacteria bacterium]|nr:alkaline shock response membrane anchor protein AmaP [Dethiobacteria bacterium]